MIELSKSAKRIVRRGMASIAMDPSAWDQATWVCDTSACFAGHIVINEDGLAGVSTLSRRDGPGFSIPARALELLGLDRNEYSPGAKLYHDVFARTRNRVDGSSLEGYPTRKESVKAYLAFCDIVAKTTGIKCHSYAKLIPEPKPAP